MSLVALALTGLLFAPATAGDSWVEDFDEGVKIARETGKDLLVDFTGSDWCRYCRQLKAEVFSQPEFLEYVKGKYVLVSLDYPRNNEAKARVPNLKRNLEIKKKYRVSGFPTVLLLTVEGDIFGKAGYQPGGAKKFVETLDQQREKNREPLIRAPKIARAFETAQGEAKEAECRRAIELLESVPASSAAVHWLIPAVEFTLELDPVNEAGLLGRALKAALPTGWATKAMIAKARAFDPENEAGLYELAIVADIFKVENEREMRALCREIVELDAKGPVKDPNAARIVYGNAALWTMRYVRDPAGAKKFARKALPFVSGDQNLRARMLQILNG